MIRKSKRFEKRNFPRTSLFSLFLGLLILMIVGFLLYSNWKLKQKRGEILSQIEVVKNEIQILEERNRELRAGISQSLTDENLEREARESLNLKKSGEEVVVVMPSEEKEEEKPKEKSLWEKILGKFGF